MSLDERRITTEIFEHQYQIELRQMLLKLLAQNEQLTAELQKLKKAEEQPAPAESPPSRGIIVNGKKSPSSRGIIVNGKKKCD